MRLKIIILLLMCWLSSAAGELKFAWLTDIHVVEGNSNAAELVKAISEINPSDSEFVILSGDLTSTGDSQLEFAAKLLSELKKPLYAIPGNHETTWSCDPNLYTFSRLFGGRTFVFRAGNTLFAGFPSGPWGQMGAGYVKPADLEAVAAKLDAELKPGDRVIFVCHYPLTPDLGNVGEVIAFMKRYPVAAVLSGHTHELALLNADGLSNAVGRALSLRHSAETAAGYNLVTVADDGTVVVCNKVIGRAPEPAYGFRSGDGRGTPVKYPEIIISMPPELKKLGNVGWARPRPSLKNPDGSGGEIVFHTAWGGLDATRGPAGEELWSFYPDGRLQAPPAVRDGLLALCVWGQPRLIVFDAATGKQKWSWSDGSDEVLFAPGNVTAVIGERNLAIVAPDRRLTVFDRATGEIRLRTGDYKFRESLGSGSDGHTAYAKTMDGRMVVIDVDAAEIVNVFDAGLGYEISPVRPIEYKGDVILAGDAGDLVRISPVTGEVKWRCRPSAVGYSYVGLLLPDNGGGLVPGAVADDGNVFVFDGE